MSMVKNLYELQGRDEALAQVERRLGQIRAELTDNAAIVAARGQLEAEAAARDALQKSQHDLEWAIDDLTGKIDKAQEELYSGRIRNPKELANLEQEVAVLKAARSDREDEAIGLMEQLETIADGVASLEVRLAELEAAWRARQAELTAEQAALEAEAGRLGDERAALLAQIDPETARFYTGLRSQKGTAVARVDQGVCQGCRLALANAELQRARGGDLVQCTSCGRILFL